MKKDLIEEIRRIHEITYNQTTINEGYIDSLLSKAKDSLALQKKDISSRADYINPDVQDFFNTLEKAAQTGGLRPQKYGSMTYQKEVEALQIALVLLGYDLPRFGIDGLYGPETAAAVNNFNKTLSESVEGLRSTLSSLGYDEKGAELTSGGQVGNEITDITSKILTDFKEADPKTTITITAGNDAFHQRMGGRSGHSRGNSIDLTLNPYSNRSARKLRKILDTYKSGDSEFNYIDEYSRPSRRSTGGHFHLEYGGGASEPTGQQTGAQTSKIGGAIATPETINKMIDILKNKNVTPEELKQYVDPEVSTGGPGVTDLDLMTDEGYAQYAEICDAFISKYPNPLNISGEMLAFSARRALRRYGSYVPPELALSQLMLEGGINNEDPNSRPIRTRNPYNIGNTETRSKSYGNVQDGIDEYYRLIAKNYIGKGKTAMNLMSDFVNKHGERYASDTNYENKLASIAQKVNKISQSVKA